MPDRIAPPKKSTGSICLQSKSAASTGSFSSFAF
jgi:hypothetical protein